MTTKVASKIFRLDTKEITKRNKDGMIIGAIKINGRIDIPEDTAIIPSRGEVLSFLLQIVKYKNNNHTVIDRSMCPNEEILMCLIDYLYKQGFIGVYNFNNDIKTLFDEIQMTDKGLDYLIDYGKFYDLSNNQLQPLQINNNININLFALNVG